MNNDTDMRPREYRTVNDISEAEITEKKSRFIATVIHVESEDEATAIIADMRKKYWDAKHNCYAYILGKGSELSRFSDDGEPSGTAGRPILEIISSNGLTDTLIVVTRYFGGVLLGTGGLVRAYSASSSAAIEAAKESGTFVTMKLMQELSIKTEYNMSGKIQYTLADIGISIIDTVYEADVIFKVAVPVDDVDSTVNKVTDVTNGKASIETGDTGYYPLTKDKA